ncbi:NosD domain-containing protein [Natronomonas amylolytica]|uniref:NosD domain-containing protein n=1 Tax=Natronomonas amylolytica TaxID=3108498 RepID=UPI00300BD7A0
MRTGWLIVGGIIGLLVVVGAGSFVVSPDTSGGEPVAFDDTVSIGLTLEERLVLRERGAFVPRAQVVYSQYSYIIGYRGVGLAAEAVDDPLVRQQFGYPRMVHVEVAPAGVELDAEGYLDANQTNEWVPAGEAFYVVDSGARIPGSATAVPFADRAAAERFAERNGGRVLEWTDRSAFPVPEEDGETTQRRIDEQHAEADATVDSADELLERDGEVVVGEDAATLEEALATAEPNTTIRLPAGTYEGPVTVDESVTIRGENATITGDGNGTVVTVTASDVAIVGVSITGVGENIRPDDIETGDWDERTEIAYGYADAGVTVAGADRVLVTGVDVETPTAGVSVRRSNGTVIDDIEVRGDEPWQEGFMGVVTIRSPVVLQNSTFHDGRDGIYTHRSHGVVVRNNRFEGGRFGVHLMYTSEALLHGNCMSGQEFSGIVVMTSPSGTVISENTLVGTSQGILTSGSDSYVGGNLVVASRQGISTNARNTLYTENTLVGNDVGFRASSIVPTSRVHSNDVVDNDEHVEVGTGPLRVWTHDGKGNYWSGAAGLDREFTPSGPIDGRLHRSTAVETLAASPLAYGLRTLRTAVPGMRTASVVDVEPRSTPVNSSRVETGRQLRDDYETNGTVDCPRQRNT